MTHTSAEPLTLDEKGDPSKGVYSYCGLNWYEYLQNHSRTAAMFAIHQCLHLMTVINLSHAEDLEWIQQNLKGMVVKGLILEPTNKLKTDRFLNADFAGHWRYKNKNDLW